MALVSTAAYAAFDAKSPLKSHTIDRRAPGPRDVAIDITHCGVCHSDLHFSRSEWMPVEYPVVPGHEILGTVTAVGKDVSKFKVGDTVGVGCLVDSCRSCPSCKEGLENYCTGGMVLTYGSPDPLSGGMTYGGYSTDVVVDQDFVLSIPKHLDPAGAAPLLCAGITTYSPLRFWNVERGTRVGVMGLGGLGHMAVKLAAAMGAEVTVFTTSPEKAADAKRFGASDVVMSKDDDAMGKQAMRLDLILNTVAAAIPLEGYMSTLKREGTMVFLGIPEGTAITTSLMPLVFGRRSMAGSLIGGLPETQEMLDFCGTHNITADVEVIPMQEINTAWDRMLKSDVRYRFSVDMASLKR